MKLLQAGVLLLFILLQPAANAQIRDTGLDSLERALEQASADTFRAVVLQKLSDYWIYKDSVKAMRYAWQILEMAAQNRDHSIQGIGHYQIAGVYMEYFSLDSAQKHHRKAIPLLRQGTSRLIKQYLAKAWHNYGAVYQRGGNEQKFMDILLRKAIPVLESIQDTLQIGVDYISIGEVLMNNDEWDKAAVYYDKAIGILKSHPRHEELPRACVIAARNLMLDENGDTPEQTRKIRKYLDQARDYLLPGENSYTWIRYFTNNGMYYHYRKDNTEKALENYERGMKLAEEFQDNYALVGLAYQKFHMYLDNQQYALAKKAGYDAYRQTKRFSMPDNWLLMLNNLVELEEKTGNIPKAYELLNRYVTLSDSVKSEETRVKILELEKKFENEKKENEILRLRNENTRQELKLQRAQLWGYLAGGIALLLIGGFLAGFKIYRNKQQIARQKEQLYRQEVEKLKQEQRLSNFSAMLEGQEQERKRVASELHDGLGGSLSGIKLKLSQVVMENSRDKQLSPVLSQLDDSVNELRRIARNLMPETLLRYGLSTALREFCRSMESGRATIVFQAYGIENDDISQTAKMMIYRIMQELVSNAVKHANASRILVELIRGDSKISLTVEDDGSGFDPDSKARQTGLGLSTVKNRVDYLKGHMELVSEPGTGTTVTIAIEPDAVSNQQVAAYTM